MAVKRIVDTVAIATRMDDAGENEIGDPIEVRKRGDLTWVSGETDYVGASEAVMVVALRTNEKGGNIGSSVPPALKTGEVYVLIKESQ